MWYTGTGDDGMTGLFGGGRVEKDSPRIEALGELDETTSSIGVARAMVTRTDIREQLLRVQRELYLLMAEIASPHPEVLPLRIGEEAVTALEADIAAWGERVAPRHGFILPGDTAGGAALDLARAVARRAERRVVSLAQREPLANAHLQRYLNRLSSLLYVLARAEEQAGGVRPVET